MGNVSAWSEVFDSPGGSATALAIRTDGNELAILTEGAAVGEINAWWWTEQTLKAAYLPRRPSWRGSWQARESALSSNSVSLETQWRSGTRVKIR